MANHVISGQAYWSHVIRPNTKFNPDGEYSIEICNLDAKNKKVAESTGLTIKNKDDDRGDFVTLKQYATNKDGSPRKISVKDSELNPFSQGSIGNGSKVNASFYPKPYTNFGGGVKGYLNSVQVIELIEYNDDGLGVVEGGYVGEKTEDDLAFA
jgi:hypothetical protein|tara:strand:+ start:196 stop:657 length:462 start_codon:yes stop_codon:yes gene_type:complete